MWTIIFSCEPLFCPLWRRAIASESAQQVLREQYYYRQHIDNLVADKNGTPGKVVQTRDYEVVFLEGKPYRRLVLVNGKPLSSKELQKQEDSAGIQCFIAGENWRISDERTWELLKRYPEWKQDSDLGKGNKGISIVQL